jgi:hypothetical protein
MERLLLSPSTMRVFIAAVFGLVHLAISLLGLAFGFPHEDALILRALERSREERPRSYLSTLRASASRMSCAL